MKVAYVIIQHISTLRISGLQHFCWAGCWNIHVGTVNSVLIVYKALLTFRLSPPMYM